MNLTPVKRGRPAKTHPDKLKFPIPLDEIPVKNVYAWVNYWVAKGYKLGVFEDKTTKQKFVIKL